MGDIGGMSTRHHLPFFSGVVPQSCSLYADLNLQDGYANVVFLVPILDTLMQRFPPTVQVQLHQHHIVPRIYCRFQQIWIPAKSRWVHTDPCENKFDKPMMYEQGWNKRLSYIVAFDADGGIDVTRR